MGKAAKAGDQHRPPHENKTASGRFFIGVNMSYQNEQQRKRQREEEERRRRHQSNTGSSSDLMNPLNPISPIYVGNDYSSSSISDSCSGGYDSGSSSDSGGSCGSD